MFRAIYLNAQKKNRKLQKAEKIKKNKYNLSNLVVAAYLAF